MIPASARPVISSTVTTVSLILQCFKLCIDDQSDKQLTSGAESEDLNFRVG